MSATPRIVVTGPPASGKTFAREVLAAWLSRRGFFLQQVAVDDILRELHPRDGTSPDGRRDRLDYAYDADDALVLHRPAEQIPAAVREAIRRCAEARGGFVLELATSECVQLAREGEGLLAGALVIGLTASAEMRAGRNAARGAGRIPDDRLLGYPDEIPREIARRLERGGARVVAVDGGVSRELVQRGIVGVLESVF